MGRYEDAGAERARMIEAQLNANRLDLANITGILFFEGTHQATIVAKISATERVKWKIDKSGTQMVPDLVAVEAEAKRMLEKALEVIAKLRKLAKTTVKSVDELPQEITHSVSAEIIHALQIEEILTDLSAAPKLIEEINAAPTAKYSQRVLWWTYDIINGTRDLMFPPVDPAEYTSPANQTQGEYL